MKIEDLLTNQEQIDLFKYDALFNKAINVILHSNNDAKCSVDIIYQLVKIINSEKGNENS